MLSSQQHPSKLVGINVYVLWLWVGLDPSCVTVSQPFILSNPASSSVEQRLAYVTPWDCYVGGLNDPVGAEGLAQ